jgi:hypothetical protein
MLCFQTKRTKAINECINGIAQDPPMAWMIIRPSIGHVAFILQKRLKEQKIDISFEEACKRVRKFKKG